jgi:hypothetical protein
LFAGDTALEEPAGQNCTHRSPENSGRKNYANRFSWRGRWRGKVFNLFHWNFVDGLYQACFGLDFFHRGKMFFRHGSSLFHDNKTRSEAKIPRSPAKIPKTGMDLMISDVKNPESGAEKHAFAADFWTDAPTLQKSVMENRVSPAIFWKNLKKIPVPEADGIKTATGQPSNVKILVA